MWRYRARITLEHLSHALQQITGKSLALLKEFLRLVNITTVVLACLSICLTQEPVLRITQYLPDVLYLQKLLFDQFHQRLDQGNVLNMTIDDYLRWLNNGSYVISVSDTLLNFFTRPPETSYTKTDQKI